MVDDTPVTVHLELRTLLAAKRRRKATEKGRRVFWEGGVRTRWQWEDRQAHADLYVRVMDEKELHQNTRRKSLLYKHA